VSQRGEPPTAVLVGDQARAGQFAERGTDVDQPEAGDAESEADAPQSTEGATA